MFSWTIYEAAVLALLVFRQSERGSNRTEHRLPVAMKNPKMESAFG